VQQVDRHLEVIDLVFDSHSLCCDLHRHSLALGHAVATLDPLVHRIQNGPREVRLGVRQSLWVVGPGSLAQGKESFTLQVVTQVGSLPRRAMLQEVPCEDEHQLLVFSYQFLSLDGES